MDTIVKPITLNLEGDSSLVLGSEYLIIQFGEDSLSQLLKGSCISCCTSSNETNPTSPKQIIYRNILNATTIGSNFTIAYAHHSNSKANIYIPQTISFTLQDPSDPTAPSFVTSLLSRAYPPQIRRTQRIKIIINPFGGRGVARRIYATQVAPILTAAGCIIDVIETTHHRHAEEIARTLDVDAWDTVMCCSGDGVPHEVWNGLALQARPRRALKRIAIAQMPCGTGNGLCWNQFGTGSASAAALAVVKAVRSRMDLISLTQGDERKITFMSQSFGIVAESDLGTDSWRWMGESRFMVGYVLRLLKKTIWPVDIAVGIATDDKNESKRMWQDYVSAKTINNKNNNNDYSGQKATKHLSGSTTNSSTTASNIQSPVDEEEADDQATSLPELKFGTVKDSIPTSWERISLPNLGNFWAGNMPIMAADMNAFPTACASDGLLDLMIVPGDIGRLRAFKLALAGDGAMIDIPELRYMKVQGFRVMPRRQNEFISVDGERIGGEAFQVEVHRGLGTILTVREDLYEAPGPKTLPTE